jgi:hypothetical protein
MRRKLGIEPGSAQGPIPTLFDLAAIGAAPIGIGPAPVRKEHGTFTMRQVGERCNNTRRQPSIAAFAGFGPIGPEDRPRADEIYITPVEIDGFGHSGAGTDQEQQERLEMPRRPSEG